VHTLNRHTEGDGTKMTSIIRTQEEDDRLRRERLDLPRDPTHLARCREFHKWNPAKESDLMVEFSVKCNWWNVFLTKAVTWLIFQILRPLLPLLIDPDPRPMKFENHSFIILCIYHFTQWGCR
jgi:hypothetical protein